MFHSRFMRAALLTMTALLGATLFELAASPAARAQDAGEDLSACPGSAPEPTQSALWTVAFCNRTGHDVVLEFHDNECPARDWSHRGDVYQRLLKRGESKTYPLCYASEPAGHKPTPGVPLMRIPGGKGVTTTWSVVGDCGERSKALNADARTFYDRGDYKSGIILLQYPSGIAHCSADTAPVAAAAPPASPPAPAPAPAAPAPGLHAAASPAPAAATAPAAAVPTPPAAPVAAPPMTNRGSGEPTLSVAVDTSDKIGVVKISRAVNVFAKGGAGYTCTFVIGVTFSDGSTWNDHGKATLSGPEEAPVATRKYFKTVSTATLTSSSCKAM